MHMLPWNKIQVLLFTYPVICHGNSNKTWQVFIYLAVSKSTISNRFRPKSDTNQQMLKNDSKKIKTKTKTEATKVIYTFHLVRITNKIGTIHNKLTWGEKFLSSVIYQLSRNSFYTSICFCISKYGYMIIPPSLLVGLNPPFPCLPTNQMDFEKFFELWLVSTSFACWFFALERIFPPLLQFDLKVVMMSSPRCYATVVEPCGE